MERPGEPRARTGYILTYLHLPIRRHSRRDHNTPGPLRPWTRLHLISRIVLNHHSSRGSPRISRGRYRCRLPLLGEMLSWIELLVLDVRIYNSLNSQAQRGAIAMMPIVGTIYTFLFVRNKKSARSNSNTLFK